VYVKVLKRLLKNLKAPLRLLRLYIDDLKRGDVIDWMGGKIPEIADPSIATLGVPGIALLASVSLRRRSISLARSRSL
jgi:hypothetical protein